MQGWEEHPPPRLPREEITLLVRALQSMPENMVPTTPESGGGIFPVTTQTVHAALADATPCRHQMWCTKASKGALSLLTRSSDLLLLKFLSSGLQFGQGEAKNPRCQEDVEA